MPRPDRHSSLRPSILAVLAALIALAGCGKDSAGPNSVASVVFITQPQSVVVGERIQPPVEVMVRNPAGDPLQRPVTVELDPNPCGWTLNGIVQAAVMDTTARFATLALDVVGRGYRLKASSEGVSATSAPFDVRTDIDTEPVVLENVLCARPNALGDGESLTYVPEFDSFWRADDNQNGISEFDRRTGTPGSEITLEAILERLPDAGVCDDGDGDPNTVCSYVNQFEQVAYDQIGQYLYVINVVDIQALDRPAIFRLKRGSCAGCFTPVSWQPLPLEPTYSGLGAVDGQLFMALKGRVYAYDYDTNQVATLDANGDSLPPAYSTFSPVVSMSYDGESMWILTNNRILHQVDWNTRTDTRIYDLDAFDFSLPRGMEVVNDTIYVLEGDAPNQIYVLSQRQP